MTALEGDETRRGHRTSTWARPKRGVYGGAPGIYEVTWFIALNARSSFVPLFLQNLLREGCGCDPRS